MHTLLASTLSLALMGAPAGDERASSAVDVFFDACLDQTATRESLTDKAAASGWTRLSLRTSDEYDWRLGFRAGEYIVHLDHSPAAEREGGSSPEQLICVVYVGPEPDGWKDEMAALEIDGEAVGSPDPYDTAAYQMPPGMTLTMWDIEGRGRVHALVEPDGNLELSVNYPTGDD